MFNTGLLILTRPIPALRNSLQCVLNEVSKTVRKTLYVHIQPCPKSTDTFCVTRTPFTSDIRNFVSEIYTLSAASCSKMDVRVLLGHISNHPNVVWDVNYTLNNKCDIVLFDDSMWYGKEDSVSRKITLDYLTQKFSLSTIKEPKIDIVNFEFSSARSVCDQENKTGKENPVGVFDNTVLGGTFDRIHIGHKIMLTEGCLLADKSLTVGVTDASMNTKKTLPELIQPIEDRLRSVKEFIQEVCPNIMPNVVPIFDMYGPSITDPQLQCVVLSQETKKGGQLINEERKKRNMKELDEFVVPLVEDKFHNQFEEVKISSSSTRKRLLGTMIHPVKENKNMPPSPYVIGLTGGIASGKSALSKRLEGLGAVSIDCDKLGHQVYVKDTFAYKRLVEEFGSGILSKNGEVYRRALGDIVFSDPEKMKVLNNIVWPEIGKIAAQLIDEYRKEGRQVVVLEAALLLEANWDNLVHEVWTAVIPKAEAIKRMMERNKLGEEEAQKRLEAQLDNQSRVNKSNVVLCTQWEYEYTQKQVEKAWNLLQDRLTKSNL